jgi:hypothetical protein
LCCCGGGDGDDHSLTQAVPPIRHTFIFIVAFLMLGSTESSTDFTRLASIVAMLDFAYAHQQTSQARRGNRLVLFVVVVLAVSMLVVFIDGVLLLGGIIIITGMLLVVGVVRIVLVVCVDGTNPISTDSYNKRAECCSIDIFAAPPKRASLVQVVAHLVVSVICANLTLWARSCTASWPRRSSWWRFCVFRCRSSYPRPI